MFGVLTEVLRCGGCGGHGICDRDTRKCICDRPFFGEHCTEFLAGIWGSCTLDCGQHGICYGAPRRAPETVLRQRNSSRPGSAVDIFVFSRSFGSLYSSSVFLVYFELFKVFLVLEPCWVLP